jgi:hypothetical protein
MRCLYLTGDNKEEYEKLVPTIIQSETQSHFIRFDQETREITEGAVGSTCY